MTWYSCNSVVFVLCDPKKKEAERPKKVVEQAVEEEVVHEENDWAELARVLMLPKFVVHS